MFLNTLYNGNLAFFAVHYNEFIVRVHVQPLKG